MESRYVGVPRERREDVPLITGEASYTDDIDRPDAVHAAFARSRYGHARIEGVDTAPAEAIDGVLDVFTAADLAESDAGTAIRADENLPGQKAPEYPLMAGQRARYMGDILAVVVAEDRYVAGDAADAVEVDYRRLDAVTDAREALAADAPTLHEYAPDNCGLDWEFGDDAGEVAEAFAAADRVVEYETHNQRVHPDAMEPRAALAEHDPDAGELTLTHSAQAPFLDRGLIAGLLGFDEADVRVVSPSVGGGFGSKSLPYPEVVLAPWTAMRVGRPVKWTATRTESHLADHHGRDFHTAGELALDADGTVRAFRTEAVANIGAYLVFANSPFPNYEKLASGCYEIPAIRGHLRAAFTNTAPTAPYRGAGRPEIIYLIERLMDEAAAELDIDPAEIRRRNFVPPGAFPYETPVSATYDSGNYERALEMALEEVGYGAWRRRQREARQEGRYLGIGVASFLENAGNGPGLPETGRVAFEADGSVVVTCGTADHGQGHESAFAGLVADEFGIDADDVRYRAGDTDLLPGGAGTFGSRSAAVGGSAIAESAREVREQVRDLAADQLEVAPEDLEFDDGQFHPAGAPGRGVDIREVVRRAGEDGDPDLEATTVYDPSNYTYPFGTHVAVVEVDPESGEVEFEEYVAVDDCGTQLNPTVVEGQVMGGVAQGIGQALYEGAVYDDAGTLTSGSLQDYALPKAMHVPDMVVEDTETPAPHNPTGVKGVGEGGAIVAPPAVVNAVVDALRPLGVEDLQMPVTAERVWRAVREAE